MPFRGFFSWPSTERSNAAWSGFLGVFAVYYAVLGFRAGVQGDNLWFDADGLLSGVYFFSAAKSYSRVKRLRRRRRND